MICGESGYDLWRAIKSIVEMRILLLYNIKIKRSSIKCISFAINVEILL